VGGNAQSENSRVISVVEKKRKKGLDNYHEFKKKNKIKKDKNGHTQRTVGGRGGVFLYHVKKQLRSVSAGDP